MAAVNGRPFLTYVLDYWISQGVKHFILSVGYKWEFICKHFGRNYRGIPIDYIIETELQGTGGALVSGIQGQSKTTLIVNGDTLFKVPFSRLLDFHIRRSSPFSMALLKVSNRGRFGVAEILDDGALTGFGAITATSDILINGGVYLAEPQFVVDRWLNSERPCSLEVDLIPSAISENENLYGLEFVADFIDIGIPSDLARASMLLGKTE